MEGLQAGFQFTDDLAYADGRVFIFEHIGEIKFGCAEKVHEGPGRAAGLKKNVVNLEPGRLYVNRIGLRVR